MGQVIQALVAVFVLGCFAVFFFMEFTNPEWFMRLAARFCFAFMSERERRSLAKAFPTIGYHYFGTTGDAEKDARIRRSTRLYGRGFVIAALCSVPLMILVAVLIEIFS